MRNSVVHVIDKSTANVVINSVLEYINIKLIKSDKTFEEKNKEFDILIDYINVIDFAFKNVK